MDAGDFESGLKAAGFTTLVREVAARDELPDHRHDWEVRGLVLAGAFTIESGGVARTYGPGESFELAAMAPHSEWAGPEGARLLLGRRHHGAAGA